MRNTITYSCLKVLLNFIQKHPPLKRFCQYIASRVIGNNLSNRILKNYEYKRRISNTDFDYLSCFISLLQNTNEICYQSNKNKIILVCGNLSPGGAERQVVNTILALKKISTLDCQLLCDDLTPGPPKYCNFYLDILHRHDLNVRQCRTFGKNYNKPVFQIVYELSKVEPSLAYSIYNYYLEFTELRPAIVHAWLDWSNVRAGIAALMAGVPKIILSGRNLSPRHFALHKEYMHPAYKVLVKHKSVTLINNSYAGAHDYEDWLNLPRNSIPVVYNGLDLPSIDEDRTVDYDKSTLLLKKQLKLNPEAKIVGGIFRLSEEKRPYLWIDVAFALLEKRSDIEFVLYGTGPELEGIKKYTKSLGIEKYVRFPGVSNDVKTVLSLFDCFVMTSRGEGTPNVILEAQWLGVPVVATDAGGVREAILDSISGTVIDKDNPKILADIVLSRINDGRISNDSLNQTRKFLLDRFSIERMLNDTLHLYNN